MVALMAAVPIGMLAACAPTPRPGGTASPSPSPDPSGSAGPGATADPGTPTELAAAGPTGTNWPSRTPRPGDTFDVTEECDCDWDAIAAAIEKVDKAGLDKTARVLVAPGELPGYTAASSGRPVLEGVGRTGRSTRILVMPRDGVGTVTFEASIRIEDAAGIAFVGFWLFPKSMVLTSVRDLAWAWSKGQAFNITSGPTGPVEDVELVECVTPEAVFEPSDTWAFRTSGNPYRDIDVVGCYLAPSYKPADSSAHCDTLQLSGPEDKVGISIRNTVIFASTNAAFIPSAGATGIVFDNSLVVAGDRMLVRYPLPAGANTLTSGNPAAVNAAGSVDQISGVSSTFIGPVRGTWLDVRDCVVSSAEPPAATSGAFSSAPWLSEIDAEWLDEHAPMPTDERLTKMWALT